MNGVCGDDSSAGEDRFFLFLRVEGNEFVSGRWEGATVQFRTRDSLVQFRRSSGNGK